MCHFFSNRNEELPGVGKRLKIEYLSLSSNMTQQGGVAYLYTHVFFFQKLVVFDYLLVYEV